MRKGKEIDVESLVRLAKKDCDAAEVIVKSERSLDVSAESGVFSDITEEEAFGFGVRVIRKGRVGFSFGNDISRFPAVAEKAIESSAVGPRMAELPGKAKYGKVAGLFDKRIERLDGRELLDRLKSLIGEVQAAGARPTYTGVECGTEMAIIANSNGVYGKTAVTSIGGGAYASDGESTGFEGKGSRRDDLDIPSFGRLAGERAVESRNPEKIGGMKKARILLHPYAVEGLFGTFIPSIDGENILRKNSALAGKLGEKLFSEELTLSDNGLLKEGLGSGPFDSEGVPCRKNAIVGKGILKSFLYNWQAALEAGVKPTGNGFRGFSNLPRVAPTNLVISAGKDKSPEADFSVLWLSGTHTTNSFSGDFSVEMKNSFLLSRGKRTAVKYGLISGNIFEVMRTARPLKAKAERAGQFITPPILIEADVIA